ncbi:MAG: DUF1320 domain-containing protein [Bilophila sp.]
MAYATSEQLIRQFGSEEMTLLSDRQGTGVLDETVLLDAIRRAESEVDSYLADRYSVPLVHTAEKPVPQVVTSITGDIARYRLTGGDIRDSDPVRTRYVDALNWLRGVCDGTISLPGLPALTPGSEAMSNGVFMQAGARPWDGVTP